MFIKVKHKRGMLHYQVGSEWRSFEKNHFFLYYNIGMLGKYQQLKKKEEE